MSSTRRAKFRHVLQRPSCIHPGSVFDAMSARMAEALEFEIGMFAGSIASAVVIGAPDIVALTLTELTEQTRRITRASNLPLMVDADHGYGNALNVMRAVAELESADVAALTIEDVILPAPFGATGESLITIDEMTKKLRAAVAARKDPALVIVGRTSALRCRGIAEAQQRVAAYEDAGVDAIFLTGATTRDQILAISAVTRLPLMLGGEPSAELSDLDFLAANRVRIALQGHAPFYAAANAAYECLALMRNGGGPPPQTGFSHLLDITLRQKEIAAWQEEYLR